MGALRMGWADLFAILLGLLLVGLVIRSMFAQWGASRETPVRGRQRAALEWLEENGYQIVRVRQRAQWTGYFDSREFRKQLIADFIVRKGARNYVVKVKSSRDRGLNGQKFREQWQPLIEGFHVHGALQIDLDKDEVHEVDYSIQSPRYIIWQKVLNRVLWMLAGALIALMWLHGR